MRTTFSITGQVGISMYRFSSDFAPYLTHPDMPQFHNQLVECRSELEELGTRAREMNLRLSFHPSQYIILNAAQRKHWSKPRCAIFCRASRNSRHHGAGQ